MRNRLLSLLSFLLIFSSCNTSHQNQENSGTTLWYEEPADKWLEALPLGNGRLGAMVFGGTETERLQLNEESLWAGEAFEVYPDNFSEHIKEVQGLILDGKISEARELGLRTLTKSPTSFRSFQPLADLYISLDHPNPLTGYSRNLDLETGIASVSYRSDGADFFRECFISAADNLLAFRISTNVRASISGSIHMDRQKDAVFEVKDNTILMDGQIIDIEAPLEYDDNPGGSGPGGKHMKFSGKAIIRLKGGQLTTSDEKILIDGADEIIILFTAGTNYNAELMNIDSLRNPATMVNEILDRVADKSYRQIRTGHIKEHSEIFNRLTLNLEKTENSNLPSDKRLKAISNGAYDPEFSALYFQFGRYLLMSSSRPPGILPANLQGLWNDRMWAPWEADYHLNINLQMNYWPADLCNLSETIIPLTSWLTGAAEKGRQSAKKLYNSDGWILYVATNPFGRSTPSASTLPSQFMNGSLDPLPGAWMSLSLWRHFEFSGDLTYLEESVAPLLLGASRFLLDYMREDLNGNLVIVPSTSPENSFFDPGTGERIRITRGSSYHSSIVREVFSSTIKAMEILEKDDPILEEISAAYKRIPPLKIGSDGRIMEWIEEYKEAEPGHRHVSHLIGLHPFSQITESDPELFDAARLSLEHRLANGGGHTGWSRAWMVNFFARLGDGEKAAEHLNLLYAKSTNTNLFDQHPPFQIDGNFGGTSGIAEMLIQSHNGYIELLPALPAEWAKGSCSGLCARGGFVINLAWDNNTIESLEIFSRLGGECKIRYQNSTIRLSTEKGKSYKIKI